MMQSSPLIEGAPVKSRELGAAVDVLVLLEAWGPCSPQWDCPADLDHDSIVGVDDLILLLTAGSDEAAERRSDGGKDRVRRGPTSAPRQ
jgi:hypothetical protein